jgi:hypothetical protein
MWGGGPDSVYIEDGHIRILNICNINASPLQKKHNLPPSIGNLTHLERLHVGNFFTKEYPEEISTLPKLNSISVYLCSGKVFPKVFARNPHVTSIELKMSYYKSFPEELVQRKDPLELDIFRANFVKLWPSIEKMRCITKLSVITEEYVNRGILDGLTNLPNLTYLYWCEAECYKLPESWADFPSLTTLILQNNTYLYYKDNPLPNTEVLMQSLEERERKELRTP